MAIFLFILMILLVAAIILHVIGVVKDGGKTDSWEHVLSALLVAFVIVALGCVAAVISDTPTAMDVYEGKTEMKYDITIRGNDTIVDSTVVLKKDDIM
jgi:hypothetical protein